MNRIEKEDVSVGTGIIGIYQRMPQKLERVFSEFIDNSTQSYNDHREELIRINKSPVCKVYIKWTDDVIVISDNAYGMDRDDFRRALKLNKPKEHYSKKSRSKYGMGLKIAAAYLGDKYTIMTSQYGSNESYESTVDILEWKEKNPTEIENKILDVIETSHYTKIIIENLTIKLTSTIDKTLRKQLALIYFKDIMSGDLEIYLNNILITAIEPKLRINTETGSEYYRSFSDSFEYNGKLYSYDGWVGILDVGSTDDAGFTLLQSGRGIALNYRPSEVFGKTNSFQYQRLIGHINLNDDSLWKVTFNKDGFIWGDGLEKVFDISLSTNREIAEIKTIAAKLRKDVVPVITNEDISKSIKKIEKKYESLKEVKRTVISKPMIDEPVVKINNDIDFKNIIKINWESIDYTFDIRVTEDDENADWVTLRKKDESKNEYYIIINGLTKYFDEYNKSACKSLIINFAVSLSLARISCIRLGLKPQDSNLFISEFNKILKYSK